MAGEMPTRERMVLGELLVKGKAGFHGEIPVDQSAKIADPVAGATVDAEARTAINAIIDVLEAHGLSAKV